MSSTNSSEKGYNEEKVQPVVSITLEQIGTKDVITSIISPSGKEVIITGDVDEAMKFALEAEGIVLDEATSKRLLRKIDFCLMPLLMFLYSVQFMDKNSNAYSSLMGIRTDLNMVGDKYSWTGTSFYLGYLFFVFPASYLIQRFPMAKTTSAFIILWGIVVCLQATPNYAGLIFLRTMLGLLESSITPTMMILTSQWFRKEEQFVRTSMWLSFNGLGTIMGSGIAYGLYIRAGTYAFANWKVLFVVIGFMSIAVGVMFLLHIPDTPAQAWWLTREEKLMVVERIRTNNQGFGNKHFKMYQLKEALIDINTWLFFFFGIATNVPNGALGSFRTILFNDDFGYSRTESLLMQMPLGAIEIVGCISCASLVKIFKSRLLISTVVTLSTIVWSCLLAFCEDNRSLKLLGIYLLEVLPVGMICAISICSSNIAGLTKKTAVNSIYLIGYCVGNVIGPQTFKESQAPHYNGAKVAMVICYSFATIFILLIYLVTWRRKVKRTKQQAEMGENHQMENMEFADLTDFENPNFVYSM